MKIFSYGGGVQSNAALVLQAQGKLNYDAFVFANVGNDSENPDTLDYIVDVARPFAEKHGVELVEVAKKGKTLYQYAMAENRTVPIPARMSNGAPGNRKCTGDWKIKVIRRAYKGAIMGLGISLDEYHRMRNEPDLEYPLIDLRLTRRMCHDIIRNAGLPDPPKSACWFCPFQSPKAWMTLRAESPELFQSAVELEERLNEKRQSFGKDAVRLHPSLLPLDRAVADQPMLWDEMSVCESGFCFT
jgi:hypothetical protein